MRTGGGDSSGMSMSSGGSAGPWGAGSSTAMGTMQPPMPMATPMSGNTTGILRGTYAIGGSGNRR